MSQQYVYIKTESAGSHEGDRWGDLWTVGFYDPKGEFQPDDDFSNRDEARNRVAFLNGSAVCSCPHCGSLRLAKTH